MEDRQVLLDIKNLKKHFVIKRDILGNPLKTVHAVDGISFKIFKGETFGLVGESGCGKSTTGRTIIGLYENTAGEVYFDNELLSIGYQENKELIRKLKKELAKTLKALPEGASDSEKEEIKTEFNDQIATIKQAEKDSKKTSKVIKRDPQNIQMIFQDPYASLNPRMTVSEIVAEGIKTHKLLTGDKIGERVYQLLERVGLKREHASRYPHEFSGGQRQRIGIARALAVDPQLIICDEPISALDVSIQAQVVNMLEDLQKEFGLTYLFIAHDLSMVKYISDRIGVMYLGKLMEVAESDPLYEQPLHPYTQALLSSIPLPDPDANLRNERIILQGDVSSPINSKAGCRFVDRCRFAKDKCHHETPTLEEVLPGRFVACHFVKEINNI